MTEQNEEKENLGGVPQTNPGATQGKDQQSDQQRSKESGEKGGRVLPPEEVGNVTSGLSDTPDRPEPANGDCAPEDRK